MTTDLQRALEQIVFAREYTCRLLEGVRPDDWFAMPGGVTHLAWQVGHLAMAEYLMTLEIVRGPRPEDAALISADFRKRFQIESVPEPDPARYPTPQEIRHVLDRVHAQVLREVPAMDGAMLAQPPLRQHRLARTRLAALLWCAQHEMLHAGQIGLLRRLLGYAAQW